MYENICVKLCLQTKCDHLLYIIKNRDNYTTVDSIYKLDDLVKESLKNIAESNNQDPNYLLPPNISGGLLNYVVLGKIPHGAMALYKLGYKSGDNIPIRNNIGNMYFEFKYKDVKCRYNIKINIDNYVELWYELKQIENNLI